MLNRGRQKPAPLNLPSALAGVIYLVKKGEPGRNIAVPPTLKVDALQRVAFVIFVLKSLL